MKQNIRLIATLLVLLSTCFVGTSIAQGILFSEYRIVLADKNIKTLQVCNPTDEEQAYLLTMTNKTMNESGAFIEIADSIVPSFSLKKNIKIFPKSIRLLPGECQEVQLQVRGSDKLDNGEYRSYLQFMPQILTEEDESQTKDEESGVAMNIVFRVSSAIPVIFRKDSEVKSVDIDSAYISKKEDGSYNLRFTINKEGNQSTYGRIVVEKREAGVYTALADIQGQAVYGELSKRRISIALPDELVEKRDLSENLDLKITYIDSEKKTKEKVILTEKEIVLQMP